MSASIAERNRQARITLTTPGAITREQYDCIRRLGALMDDETKALWDTFNMPQINPATYVIDRIDHASS